MTYYPTTTGSPLIPPEFIALYFAGFITLLLGIYIYLRLRYRQVHYLAHLKRLLFYALVIKILAISCFVILAVYWLAPSPMVQEVSPKVNTTQAAPNVPITIFFDRPIDRKSLQKAISPDTPGVWVFEAGTYYTHLFRKVVFYPERSLKPNTKFTVTLSHIHNFLQFTAPYNYQFSFTTQKTPQVLGVAIDNHKDVDITQPIQVALTQPNNLLTEFSFKMLPAAELTSRLNAAKTIYTLTPTKPLKQGTHYILQIDKTDTVWDLQTNTIVSRGETMPDHTTSFTTVEAPGIKGFLPNEAMVPVTSSITIQFSQPMDKQSVEDTLTIAPGIVSSFLWMDENTLEIKPKQLAYETTYTVTIPKNTKAKGTGFIEKDIQQVFTTIGSVKVLSVDPKNNWTGVAIANPIKITFDQQVDKKSAQDKFSLSPTVNGEFSWSGNTMIFKPNDPLAFTTHYTVALAQGVKSIAGLNSKQPFTSSFTTQDAAFKLNVIASLQQYTLSCEAAALRMALVYKGAAVNEDALLGIMGVDPTPHSGDIWGDPYEAFVGNVRGTQMRDGYGVYWGPIEKAAKQYRDAKAFEGWSIDQLTQAISGGNPVVIWVYSSHGIQTSWHTTSGKNIYAVRDEHAVTAVGFVGPASNPTEVIINDPLIGQVYWPRGLFDSKWGIFNRSGVVVY